MFKFRKFELTDLERVLSLKLSQHKEKFLEISHEEQVYEYLNKTVDLNQAAFVLER